MRDQPTLSTVVTGASPDHQVVENLATLDVIPLVTPDVRAEIEAAVSER